MRDIVRVDVTGPILFEEALIQELESTIVSAIESHGSPKVVVDFSKVKYVSSAVFGKLVAIHRRLKPMGQRLRLSGMSTLIRQMFAVTHMDSLFDVHETVEAALESFPDERG
ncbi:MAG: STAS domain-containing protein [Phycisphaeraceae bacterium]